MNLEFTVIPFDEWRSKISPLWPETPVANIAPISNTYGIVRYEGAELFEKVLLFPIEMRLGGRPIGWTSVYNISDWEVRIRGLYVLPEYRGNGFGYRLCDHAISLWPRPWTRCVGFWRSTAFPSLEKNWGLKKAYPEYPPRAIRIPKNGDLKTIEEYLVIFGYKDFNQDEADD